MATSTYSTRFHLLRLLTCFSRNSDEVITFIINFIINYFECANQYSKVNRMIIFNLKARYDCMETGDYRGSSWFNPITRQAYRLYSLGNPGLHERQVILSFIHRLQRILRTRCWPTSMLVSLGFLNGFAHYYLWNIYYEAISFSSSLEINRQPRHT